MTESDCVRDVCPFGGPVEDRVTSVVVEGGADVETLLATVIT